MEACAGANFSAVKPYVKTNKSDYIDAEAIAEPVGRPTMRFVPIKTDDQLDMQSLHRVRERWVIRRTAVVNQIRGLLLERGISLRQQLCRASSKMRIPDCLALFVCSSRAVGRSGAAANWIGEADGVMERATRENEVCRRLIAIPGIGPLTATALIAAIENGAAFRKDREFSAWVVWFQGKLRPVARRSSEAATPTYESCLFRGARVVMLRRTKQSSGLSTCSRSSPYTNTTLSLQWLWPTRWPGSLGQYLPGKAYRPSLLADDRSTCAACR
jgi:transposase